MPSQTVEVVLMRGGTSKGVFVRQSDAPPRGPELDRFVLDLLGSPDPLQLDGLGGSHSSTSKVMIVGPSDQPGCDVEYLFAQAAVDRPLVDYNGNCGNLTAAVAVFAVDEGWAAAADSVATVTLYNLNTRSRIRARVPLEEGRAAVLGEAVVAGVPGAGAPILTEYLDPAGVVTGKLFPTGQATNRLPVEGFAAPIAMSILDVAGPVCLVLPDALGLEPTAVPSVVNADPVVLAAAERIRRAAGAAIGIEAAGLPRLAMVAPPQDHVLADGAAIAAASHDLIVRAFSMQRMHHAVPFTVLQALGVAAVHPGTLASRPGKPLTGPVAVAHPKGLSEVVVDLEQSLGTECRVRTTSVIRTARRLMEGRAYLRQSSW